MIKVVLLLLLFCQITYKHASNKKKENRKGKKKPIVHNNKLKRFYKYTHVNLIL
jgi:hypothetical protein